MQPHVGNRDTLTSTTTFGIEATPSPRGSHHISNFDYVRLAAATAVIYSHAHLLADGTMDNEPFMRWTGQNLGVYGVLVFFTVSGFLITKSAHERASLPEYFLARMLRIYPALIVCAAFCAFVLGPIYTSLPAAEFWASGIPFRYVLDATITPDAGKIMPSLAFAGADYFREMVNGSLWSIPYELYCYVIVGVLLVLGLLTRTVILGWAVLSLTFIFMPGSSAWNQVMGAFALVSPSFAGGAAIYFLFGRRRLPAWPVLVCLVLAVAVWALRLDYRIFPLYACYPILWFACGGGFRLPSLKKFGDISYGIYLYGWPMEQVARSFFATPPHWSAVFGIGLVLAVAAGWLSWHLIERRVLALKKRAS